jgi:DNA helicase HerA-like ATPase
MSRKEDFIQQITEGYSSKGESIILGALLDGEALSNAVKIPLKTLNRHGLIAGATGGILYQIAKEEKKAKFITERMPK